ncbi:MAG: FtsQ-type POTRA domain-containing protein [Hyphomicrobiales bacterium]|nr:FtsQ-type POTRA domain-containing protein [Hyphomicrobiales bacterium]
MDGRGRVAQSLKGMARRRATAGVCAPAPAAPVGRISAVLDRWAAALDARLPRGGGLLAAAAVVAAGLGYGVVKGEHVPALLATLNDIGDAAGNAAGFRITSITLGGHQHMTREEILALAGITGTTSLLLLDVERTRLRLKSNPWIADANVLKLFPGELQIEIKERAAFALWQKDGKVSVIAADGIVLEPFVPPQLVRLPLVVGSGAETRAAALLAALAPHSELRDHVRASVLVAERRWNLRLTSGIDVLLPEGEIAGALERLVTLAREKSLLTRDIVSVDLRLADRVTVRLSDDAAQARSESLKEKSKKKGGSA